MGQGLSCSRRILDQQYFAAAKSGEIEAAESILRQDPTLIRRTTVYSHLSSLHIAAEKGRVEMLSLLLERLDHADVLNRHKQLAAIHGKIDCVEKLLQAGANILMFDSLHGRTCLHYAAYYGHLDCLRVILQAARSNPIAESCYQGSTPLHLAARGGCVDCVRELLAWGADRLQMDSAGRIPYSISFKKKHMVCGALLNPSSAEPLVWPSPLKFISELNQDTKLLLETALMEANREREKKIFEGMVCSLPSLEKIEDDVDDDASEAGDAELCCICFDQACSIEVQDCGHQMCAHCTLALCCYNKPNPTARLPPAPVCPFCRSNIARLVAVKSKTIEDRDKESSLKPRRSRKSWNLSEGSSSFKGLSSAMGSFGKMGSHGSGRIADINDKI